jgi:uncharacterized protein (DUF1810 family)
MVDLERFKKAQDADFDAAMQELRAGRKRSHWIWYIFPQLEGLGMSGTARYYGIRGPEEAIAYVKDPVLRARLVEAAKIVASQRAIPLTTLMGSPIDALKLVSSMTLFARAARQAGDVGLADQADSILATAAEQGYEPCRRTLARFGEQSR